MDYLGELDQSRLDEIFPYSSSFLSLVIINVSSSLYNKGKMKKRVRTNNEQHANTRHQEIILHKKPLALGDPHQA